MTSGRRPEDPARAGDENYESAIGPEDAVARTRLESMSQVKRELFAKRLAGQGSGLASAPVQAKPVALLGHANADLAFWSGSLSYAEERFWMAYMLQDQSSAYHIPATLRLTGKLDVAALSRALEMIMARHDILRTRYPVTPEGELTAVVDKLSAVRLEAVLADGDPREVLSRATAEPFDLEAGPLIRPVLLKTADNEHYLHFTLHHIITDGWSMMNLLDELTATYNSQVLGIPADLPELTMQYRDHALQQRTHAGQFEDQAAYWQQALSGAPHDLGLHTDRPRQAFAAVPGKNLICTFGVGPARELARQTRTTLFMVLLGAFATVLGRHSDSEDVVIGTPVAGRRNPASEPLLGCFINTVAIRTDLSGDPTFGELLGRVRKQTLRAYDNQDMPFQHVARERTERSGVRSTFIQAWMALQNFPEPSLAMTGLVVKEIPITTDATKFDITFYLCETGGQMELEVEYDSSLFEDETVRGFAREFVAVLDCGAGNPDRRLSELIGARA